MEGILLMTKKKNKICVTVVYDGGLDAVDVFLGKKKKKYAMDNKKSLFKSHDTEYNNSKSQDNLALSGLCR